MSVGRVSSYVYGSVSPGSGCVAGTQGLKSGLASLVGVSGWVADCAGGVVSRSSAGGVWSDVFDVKHRLVGVSGPGGVSMVEVYGPGGRWLQSGGGRRVLYLPGQDVSVSVASGVVSVNRQFVVPGGGVVAARRSGGGVSFVGGDVQGSVSWMVDAVSGVVSRARYFPFGQVRGVVNQMLTDRGFVGRVEDDSTGLDYLGARFLDPGSGMFLKVDPLVGVTGDPYLYAGGNPATLSDPNGLEALPGGGWLFEGGGVQAQLARDRDYQARVNLWNDINHRDRPDKKAMFSNDRGSSVWLLAIAAVVLIGIGCVASGVALCATAAAAIGTPALEIANDVANGAPTGTGESAQLLTLLRARPVIGPATEAAGDTVRHYTTSEAAQSMINVSEPTRPSTGSRWPTAAE